MYEHSDEFINKMDAAIGKARDKHGVLTTSLWQAVSILVEEVGEVAQAVNDAKTDQAMAELLDVAAVAYRFYHMLRRQKLDRQAKK